MLRKRVSTLSARLMVLMASGFTMPGGAPVSADFPFLKLAAMPACCDGRVIKNASPCCSTSLVSCMNLVGAGAGAVAFIAASNAAVICWLVALPLVALPLVALSAPFGLSKNSAVVCRVCARRCVALFKKSWIFPLVTGPNLGSLLILCFRLAHLRSTSAASLFWLIPKKSNNSPKE